MNELGHPYLAVPWIDHFNPAILKIRCIAGYKFCPMQAHNSGNHRVKLADGSSGRSPAGANLGVVNRRVSTKWEDAPFKVLIENKLRHLQKLLAPASLRQQGDAVQDFRLGDRCRK